jgi:PAS domain S-box-containing protein
MAAEKGMDRKKTDRATRDALGYLVILSVFFAVCACPVLGSTPEGLPLAYVLDHQNGFSASFPSAMTVDREGRFWVSSDLGGLFVGDGIRFLKVGLPQALTGRSICSIAADPYGRLWVLSSGGLGIFENDKWQVDPQIRQYEPMHPLRAEGIFSHPSGKLAIMASGHAYRIPPGERPQELLLPGQDADGEAGLAWKGDTLVVNRSGRFWQEEGNAWTPLPTFSFSPEEQSRGPLRADGAGHLYLLTNMRLHHLGPGAAMWRTLPDLRPDNNVRMTLLQDGRIWILKNGQAWQAFQGTITPQPIPQEITLPGAKAICLDQEGNIWISNGTLVRLPAWGMVRVHTGPGYPPTGLIWGIRRDPAGRLWVASEAGLFRRDDSGWQAVPGIQMAKNIQPGPDGQLYVGDRNDLIRVEMRTLKAETVKIPLLTAGIAIRRGPVIQGEKLWVIDANGRLILGTWGKGGWTWAWDPLPETGQKAIADIMKDDMGRLWAIFFDQVYCRVDGKWEKLPPLTGSRGGGPMGISFLSMEEGLVAQYDPPAVLSVRRTAAGWRAYPLIGPEQLRDIGVLYSIGQDPQGTIWIGSDRGVVRIEPGDPPRFQRFGADQGLPTNDTNQEALLVEGADRVWVGTTRGLAEIRVKEMGPIPPLAAPSFLEVHRGPWVAQGPADVLDIQYGRGPISWELGFSGPAAGHDGRFEFRKLGGGPWTVISGAALQFPMIPSGHHAYEVRIMPASGQPGPARRIDIHVHPPWYQHPLAYMLWGILAAGFTVLGIRWRFAILGRRNRGLTRAVNQATQELRQHRENLEMLVAERTAKLMQTSNELHMSEARYQILFENAKDGIALAEAETGRIVDCNRSLCQMVGREKAELIGQSQSILHPPPSTVPGAGDTFQQHRNTDSGLALEDTLQAKSGKRISVEILAARIKLDDREFLLGIFRDISDRKQAENVLSDLIDKNPISIQIVDKNGFTLKTNPAHTLLFGSVPPPDFSIFADLQNKSKELEKLILLAKSGEIVHLPDINYNVHDFDSALPDAPVWIRAIIFPLKDSNNKPERFVFMHENITERKRAEQALHDNELKYRALFETADDAILLFTDGRWIDCNSAALRVFGCTREKIIGEHPKTFSPPTQPDGRNSTEEAIKKIDLAYTVGPQFFEWTHCRLDGTPFPAEVSLNRLDLVGKPHMQAIVRDISKRRQAEEALQKSELHYKQLFDAIPESVLLIGMDRCVVAANQASARLYGYESPQQLEGFDTRRLIAERDRERASRTQADILQGEERPARQYIEVRRDGSEFIAEVMSTTLHGPGQEVLGYIGITRDITAFVKAEEALKESEARYHRIIETANSGIWTMDRNRRTTFVNGCMASMLGLEPGEIIGRPVEDFMLAEDLPAHRQRMAQRQAGEKGNYQNRFRRSDGSVLWTLVSAIAMMDASGSFDGSIGMFIDITERKQAEDRIRASLKEKEVLLQEIHHRVKNNLQIISGLLTLQADQAAGKSLDDIFHASQGRIHSMALIHEKLYSSNNLSEIAFEEYLRTLTKNIFSSYNAVDSRIITVFETEPVLISIEKAIPLGLIVNELVTNALKHAFPAGRQGEISITLQERTGTARRAPTDGENIPTYELIITDDGIGLPAGFKADTQKSLGMHLISILAKQIQAELEVKTGPGTEFRLVFSGQPANAAGKDKDHGG